MKTRILQAAAATTLGLMLTSNTQADTRTWDFDDWFGPAVTNLTLASTSGSPEYQGWNGGNPNGFLQLTKGAAGQNLAVVFPDIDNGAPVKAFTFRADLRVGNGTVTPADGFSISYVRENDPALINATTQVVYPGAGWPYDPTIYRLGGYAGGDSAAQTTDPAGSTNPESGSKTGVSISFDAWAGNWLPDTGAGGVPGPDRVGVFVRVDDKTLISRALTEANQDCSNTNSMQTGTNDASNLPDILNWCRLEVQKTTDNKLTVIWKGAKILDNYQIPSYSVHRGRIILAGRTGGSWQNVNFDNVYLETVPAIEATLEGLTVNPDLKGWTFTLKDTGASAVTNISQVIWNGVNVTAAVTSSKVGDTTTGVYTQAGRLPAGSANQVVVTYKTAINQTLTGTGNAVTPGYFVMPAADVMPLSSVAGQPRGMVLGPTWQTTIGNPNTVVWTEEQILGLRGANLITGTWPTTASILDYQNDGPEGQANGNFRLNGSTTGFWDGADYDVRSLGFGSNPAYTSTDNGTIEWFTYVNFPAAGDYTMVFNSDDGFQLSTARHAKDRMGSVISLYNGGRGNGTGLGAGTIQRVIVEAPGVYPIRGLMQNGGGGFNLEWYTLVGTNLYLVNSNSTPEALQAWQSATGTGCYVESAIPVRSATGVPANQGIQIKLGNGNPATVQAGSIVLKVDGVTVSPTVSLPNVTLAPIGPSGVWPSGSTHTVALSFTDSASKAYAYTWTFSVGAYTLMADGFPLGSQDPSKVGFMYSTYKVDKTGTTDTQNRIYAMEQVLQGWWGPNVATLASGPVTGVINFNVGTDQQGNFQSGGGYPDAPVSGIPGTAAAYTTDAFANEINTFIEFPTAGYYQLGFNSDDGFRTTRGFARPSRTSQIIIHSPASIAGGMAGVLPAANAGLEVFATNDVTGQLVLTDPITASTDLVNAAQVAGKIAVCFRGVNGFGDKIAKCAAAGAIGVIVANSRPEVTPAEGAFPIEMGATAGPIPSVMTFLSMGQQITNALASGPVMGTLAGLLNSPASLGQADVGRGATDTIYELAVLQPGLYPLRTMWFQGNGGGNCEWFSMKDGVRTLLNDLTNPNALKCYSGLLSTVKPTVTITSEGGQVVVSTQGTLQSADKVDGPYVDVYVPYPVKLTPAGQQRYWRARQ